MTPLQILYLQVFPDILLSMGGDKHREGVEGEGRKIDREIGKEKGRNKEGLKKREREDETIFIKLKLD